MDIKDLNNLIPADLKVKIKAFAAKFNAPPTPVPAPVPAPAPAPVQLQEAPLEDGTVLKYDTPTLAVGSVVKVVGPEGEMAAPAGELKLQDGTVLVVETKDGNSVVTSVTPAAPVPVLAPELAAAIPQIQTQLKEVTQKFLAVQEEKTKLEETVKAQFETHKTELEGLKKDISEFMQMFAQVLDIPSAAPIQAPENKFASGVDRKAEALTKHKTA